MAYLTIASSCLAYTAFAWLAQEHHARDGRDVQLRESRRSRRCSAGGSSTSTWASTQLAGMAVMFAGVALVSWPQKEVKRLDEDQQKDPSTAGCG